MVFKSEKRDTEWDALQTGIGNSDSPLKWRTRTVQYRTIVYLVALSLIITRLWHSFGYLCVFPINLQITGYTSATEREKLFLSVPSPDSALEASRAYATHPHLAGSTEDFVDAQVMLDVFQTHFDISPPSSPPLFSAGTPSSRNATLNLTSQNATASAWIDVYYPLLNTPLDRKLEILGPDGKAVWSADLEEDGDPLDDKAAKYKDAVPAFHGLSRDGQVDGQLVYAAFGRKEDFDQLISAGANLTGKIVIVRYGGIFRGLKVKGAQELGAAGVLIYSDPHGDGVVSVEYGYQPYPAGPARNPTSVQRGSVQFLSMYPGDPVTPGYPAYENVTRTEGNNIPKIPSLPISWSNAQKLLKEISDEVTLDGRASEAKVRLVNHVDTKITPIWNTMASIPGHLDEVVIIGCHRDAWVMGAADPTSGTVSLHEVIRGFGVLLKHGWKPLRTIVFASWDGEEYGLVGSTEWGEDFADWISEHVVAYLNVDTSVAGSKWAVAGSPSLAHLIQATALDVAHPTKPGKTLWDARDDLGPFKGKANNNISSHLSLAWREANSMSIPPFEGGMIKPLGSGSDYTVFLQRLGVASTDQGFANTRYDAPYHYHSIYDSQRWQELYADAGFNRHVAIAKYLGLMGLRMVDSTIIPLNTTHYAFELDKYLKNVENLASTSNISLSLDILKNAIGKLQAASIALDIEKGDAEKKFKELLKLVPVSTRDARCKQGRFKGVADWTKRVFGSSPRHQNGGKPCRLPSPLPLINLGDDELWKGYLALGIYGDDHDPRGQIDDDRCHGRTFRDPYGPHSCVISRDRGCITPEFRKASKRVQRVNRKLIDFERGFISEEGIKDRTWYRHLGVAPGKWLGYGATVFPALTEALVVDQNVTLAEYETRRLVMLIEKLADKIQP